MRKMILGLSALMMATSAVAQPKYLHCSVGDNSFDVTADEAKNSIVYGWHGDGAIAADGRFDRTSIFWVNDHPELFVGTNIISETFDINRTTLAIKNVQVFSGGDPAGFKNTIGQCKIQKPVKQAI